MAVDRGGIERGPEAFVMKATSFEKFETAMTKKLLKELQVLNVSKAGVDR